MASYILWIVLVILLIVVYIWSALSTPKETIIVQTSMLSFKPELLNEKNPLIVEDRICHLDQFLQIAFKWVTKKDVSDSSNSQGSQDSQKVTSSYLVFWSNTENITITICRPGGSPVDIILYAQNILVLPMRWTWNVMSVNESANLTIVAINTLFGLVASHLI